MPSDSCNCCGYISRFCAFISMVLWWLQVFSWWSTITNPSMLITKDCWIYLLVFLYCLVNLFFTLVFAGLIVLTVYECFSDCRSDRHIKLDNVGPDEVQHVQNRQIGSPNQQQHIYSQPQEKRIRDIPTSKEGVNTKIQGELNQRLTELKSKRYMDWNETEMSDLSPPSPSVGPTSTSRRTPGPDQLDEKEKRELDFEVPVMVVLPQTQHIPFRSNEPIVLNRVLAMDVLESLDAGIPLVSDRSSVTHPSRPSSSSVDGSHTAAVSSPRSSHQDSVPSQSTPRRNSIPSSAYLSSSGEPSSTSTSSIPNKIQRKAMNNARHEKKEQADRPLHSVSEIKEINF